MWDIVSVTTKSMFCVQYMTTNTEKANYDMAYEFYGDREFTCFQG